MSQLLRFGREEVAIHVHRDRYRRMTEVALDDERVSSFSYKQRRGRVPKIMHPDPRKAGCAQRRKPDAASEVAIPQRAAALRHGEDQSIRGGVRVIRQDAPPRRR